MSTAIPANAASFTLAEVARATGGVAHGTVSVVGVSTDTRAVARGNLFVALRGANFDGHLFLKAAVESGAVALLIDDVTNVPSGVPHVIVPDTLRALGDLARAHRIRWGRTVVAITGSAGKTTTKNLVAGALRGAGKSVLATVGNLNNRVGVPHTLFCLESAHEIAVVEMGTSERGEIARLAEIGVPDVAVVTRVAVAHAEGIGTIEDVAHEKGALFRALAADAIAIANADDARVLAETANTEARVIRYGIAPDAEVHIDRAVLSPTSTKVCFSLDGATHDAELALVGDVVASNAAAGLAVAFALGLSPTHALAGMAKVMPDDGRMRVRDGRRGSLVLDDTYNANPTSMEAALRSGATFAKARGARLLLVLGDMKELGTAQADEHAKVGKLAVELGCAMLVAVGDAMRAAASEARHGGVTVAEIRDAATAASLATDLLGTNDVVVVKGSRSMGMERVVHALCDAEEGR